MTRKVDALLAEYGESHQNETNKAVHWVCVPVIVWTVMVLFYSLPVPSFMGGINWLMVVLALSIIYYFTLSPSLAVGFVIFAAISYGVLLAVEASVSVPVWQVAVVVFVLAWIGQFWGHKVEGKKPSFLKDIQFLLIGPAWLMSFIYRKLGLPV